MKQKTCSKWQKITCKTMYCVFPNEKERKETKIDDY